jgi:hypothetical protein
MNYIYLTGFISLIIQIITGIFDLYVLTLPVSPAFLIIKDLLLLEICVQILEGGFYVWLVSNFHRIENITKYRYWDWVITTPTMLISLSFYLLFLKSRQENKVIEDTSIQLIHKNIGVLVPIIILNALMLLFGYLGETGRLNHTLATLLGFIPFLFYFFLIYIYFAKWTEQGKTIFWLFFGIWTVYGIASLMNYRVKNIMYNILDLFAKNLFGIFLAAIVYMNHIK